jgi:hypothetical protein
MLFQLIPLLRQASTLKHPMVTKLFSFSIDPSGPALSSRAGEPSSNTKWSGEQGRA